MLLNTSVGMNAILSFKEANCTNIYISPILITNKFIKCAHTIANAFFAEDVVSNVQYIVSR